MGLETKTLLRCDRCGRVVELVGPTSLPDAATERRGWTRVDDRRALCPDCSPGYETIVARNRVAVEDYVSGREGPR